MGQLLPTDLATAEFGLTGASLDIHTKDNVFRNNLLGQSKNFIKEELFETLYPGLTNDPSDALGRISQ